MYEMGEHESLRKVCQAEEYLFKKFWNNYEEMRQL